MADVTENALTRGGVRPANSFGGGGYYPSPLTWYGWLVENDTYYSGEPLIVSATPGELGGIAFQTAEPADNVMVGVTTRLSPRRQDLAPLTSATAPASALPLQRTLPASLTPDPANPADEDSGILYHPFLPGAVFAAHHVSTAADDDGGVERTSAQADFMDGPTGISFGQTTTGAHTDQEIDYNVEGETVLLNADATGVVGDHCVILGWANPQPIGVESNAIVAPGGATLKVGTHQSCLVFFTVVAAGSKLF